MRITVLECDWGDTQRDDIEKLLQDVASHIVRELREPFDETIHVLNLPDEEDPMAFFREPGVVEYKVNLTAKNQLWSRFAYQFAHEFCHVLSRHDRLKANPNNWFHESICELASLFVLRRMADRWPTCPPCENWADYAASLDDYVKAEIDGYRKAEPVQFSHTWLSNEEGCLRKNRYSRTKNALVALQLLPVFEQTPQGWNAVRRLPESCGPIDTYIKDWKAEVEEVDRPFVAQIEKALSHQGRA